MVTEVEVLLQRRDNLGNNVPVEVAPDGDSPTGFSEPVLDAAVRAALTDLLGRTPDLAGTWSYYGGTNDAGLVVTGRVMAISAYATASGATISINGGDAIPVPVHGGLTLSPRGNLVSPTIAFTGTAAYFVEVVA